MNIRLFAHRGFASKTIAQNSVASLENARRNGFRAIEFDIWFFNSELVIKHAKPIKKEIKDLARLKDFFRFKNDFIYWLDFKNLNEKNCEEVLDLVKKEIKKSGIKLEQIYFAPFITNYKKSEKILQKIRKTFGKKAKLVAVCESLKSEKAVKNLRDFLTKNEVKCLSIFHQLIDKKFIKIFPEIEIFAWTINDLKTLRKLEKLGVGNFATDKICP